MLKDKLDNLLTKTQEDEMQSLYESIIYDLENLDIIPDLRQDITESMLMRHNIISPDMHALFEEFDTSNTQDADWKPADDGDSDEKKYSNKEKGDDISIKRSSIIKRFINGIKNILDKIIQWIKKAVMFLSEKIFNNEKFLKEHESELDEILKNDSEYSGKLPSISLKSIENGNKYYNEKFAYSDCIYYTDKLLANSLKEGKTIDINVLLYKSYSLGKGDDMYSVKQAVRESYLDSNRGKEGKIKLSDSIKLLNDYGRDYLKELKESINAYKKNKVNIGDIVEKLEKSGAEQKVVEVGTKTAVNISVTILQEKFNIMRQGIAEHEKILKSAILMRNNGNGKEEK